MSRPKPTNLLPVVRGEYGLKIWSDGRIYGATPQQRVILTSNPDSSTGCWNWRGKVEKNGYGRLNQDGRWQLAHRFSYEAFVGPIPDGLTIDHQCFNQVCVNPDHMTLATVSENSARQRRLMTGCCINGHEWTPENTMTCPRWGKPGRTRRFCRECARAKNRAARRARKQQKDAS